MITKQITDILRNGTDDDYVDYGVDTLCKKGWNSKRSDDTMMTRMSSWSTCRSKSEWWSVAAATKRSYALNKEEDEHETKNGRATSDHDSSFRPGAIQPVGWVQPVCLGMRTRLLDSVSLQWGVRKLGKIKRIFLQKKSNAVNYPGWYHGEGHAQSLPKI